jgi:cytoskeleton protein RodZ
LNRVLRGGETWPVPDHTTASGEPSPLFLTTGNAGGTELLVNGVAAAPLGGDGSVRRDLPLDAEAIRDGKLAANNPQPVFHVTPHNQ